MEKSLHDFNLKIKIMYLFRPLINTSKRRQRHRNRGPRKGGGAPLFKFVCKDKHNIGIENEDSS